MLALTTVDRMIADPRVKATPAQRHARGPGGRFQARIAFDCRSRTVSSRPLGWARSRPRCCRISRPDGRSRVDALVGVVVELAHKLDVSVP
ncbi:MAG: hypothetical protein WDO24_25095 [Pseudomonadota bacterium]